jgi:restriction system protein
MDPRKFEELIKDLLVKMGYEAQLTKASHDGGVDIEAVNPQPIVGGKVVVQCKRFSGTVGASVVRDLYGVVMAVRASKGILITTSDFSSDARSFAEGNQLELINGRQLVDLLRRFGFSVSDLP